MRSSNGLMSQVIRKLKIMCIEVGFKSSVSPPSACILATSSAVRAQRRRRIVGHIVPGYGEAYTTERYQLILGHDMVRMLLLLN